MSRDFTSDNVSAACPAVMAALDAANTARSPAYGNDPFTARLRERACQVFEREVAVYPVATGTAANALALAQFVPPFGAVYCHERAHIVTDECAAPEFFSGGAKLIGLAATDGKLRPAPLEAALAYAADIGVHHVKPAAVSLTQATECGTVYTLTEIAALATVAQRHGLAMHMDGARFANALAHLGCSAADATWRAGVDVLSLGATKNGALCAEAVIFFDPARARDFERRRKQGGHLWSKLRFLSAQLLAYLDNDLWLENARHANAMAQRLAGGLARLPEARLLQSVDANEVFLGLPEDRIRGLEEAGFGFYRWSFPHLEGLAAVRLVTSYLTSAADVDGLIAAAQRLAPGSAGL